MVDKANILVIDDEMGPRESLKMILKPYYNVYAVERGGQAVELLNLIPIDLVTVDLKMPGLPGTKVLEKIKQHNPEIEAIIITGYGSMDTAIEGLRLGAFDYLSKPFDVNHVLSLVRRALERRQARLKLKQLKSDFLTNVSHELRTPLSVVIGFVSLLLNQLIGKLTDEQHEVLEKVYKNSGELLELIDNVLCLTSLEAGDLSKVEEEFDVGMVIKESVKKYEKILEEKEVELSVQAPSSGIWIVSDCSKVAQIFQNLLHNAVKFTPRGQIVIKAHRSAPRGMVDLEIVDTGIGIPRDQIDAMFQPFQQFDSSIRRQYSGLGLGLTVARRLTDFLGGTLEVRSQPGHGTHALLSLPYN
ncbi:MAG: response regulator [Deltaproteobacteria bacterium]|nr:response regulator [Deltaproteobacteria bacterium]